MTTTDSIVAGVDGCRDGWVVVSAATSPGSPTRFSVEVTATLDRLIAATRTGTVAAVAVDMPIGLLDRTPRAADTEARRYLGPRRSSIFPTPVRAALVSVDYVDACARSRAACGKALSLQAFHLLPKIRQLDGLIEPTDQERVVEAHPECAFARMAGAPLTEAKATPAGRTTRRRLLEARFGPGIGVVLDSKAAPVNDLLDAAVLVATALHVLDGSEYRLGGEFDPRARRAEIVY